MRTAGSIHAAEEMMERRRYTRFDIASSGSKLALIARSGQKLEMEDCALYNISYGGMCFRSKSHISPGDVVDFLIDLEKPLKDLVLVKARIEWTGRGDDAEPIFGARFLDSSKGWLAGMDDTVH